MPYTINAVILDFGGIYGGGLPPLLGTITPFPGPPDMAVPNPATPMTLLFPSPSSPPIGNSTVLVRDTGPPGDLFRSGVVSSLPPSPATLMVFTAPTMPVPFSGIGATGIGPLVFPIPSLATALVAALSAGTFIPLSLTITGVRAPTSLAITVTGTLLARVGYFFTTTYTFTSTFTAVPAPSGDATDRSRILSITAAAPTLTIPGVFGFISAALAPAVAAIAASRVEATINSTIAAMATPGLASLGFQLSPTAVICARSVAVLPSGVLLQLTASDLFGPAIVPLPKHLNVAITPAPEAGIQQVYTVTVTDSQTKVPLPQADITLHNRGGLDTIGPLKTNGGGQVTFNVALAPRIVLGLGSRPIPETGVRVGQDRVVVFPSLTVALAGYVTHRQTLELELPGP